MLTDSQVEQLAAKASGLLWEVGIGVENDEVTRICLDKGCRAGPDHRIRIPVELVDELIAYQRQTQDEYERNHALIHTCGPDWTHHLTWTQQQEAFRQRYRKQLLMQAFDCGPTVYYDYGAGAPRPVEGDVFETMLRFAQATPEIGYTSMWYRQSMPPMIERLDALRLAMDFTDKFAGIEAIYPEVVKYLKEASEILTGDPASSTYLAGSECMTMPLILEKRSAQDILERHKHGVHRYHVASMPTLGVSTPVTLAGSIAMAAAEILGGMVICWCVDPETDISGRMITLITDMRNGNSTTFGPAYAQYDNAVRQIFNQVWGGHCMVEVFFSPTACRPGLQAVFENWYGTECRRRWEGNADIPYGGMGTLHNGGMGSPTQFMLDMEIRRAGWSYSHDIAVDDEDLNWDEVVETCQANGNFLASDHTLRHCHDLWNSPLFRSDDPTSGGWDGSEKAILDQCEEMWRANLEQWSPPRWSEDEKQAMDAVVKRARAEFGIGQCPPSVPT